MEEFAAAKMYVLVEEKSYKKFVVTVKDNTFLFPEERLADIIEGEIVEEKKRD